MHLMNRTNHKKTEKTSKQTARVKHELSLHLIEYLSPLLHCLSLSSSLFLGFGFGGDLACFSSDVVVIVVREELLEEPEICCLRKHNDTTRNSMSHSAAKEHSNTRSVISSRLREFLKLLVVTN